MQLPDVFFSTTASFGLVTVYRAHNLDAICSCMTRSYGWSCGRSSDQWKGKRTPSLPILSKLGWPPSSLRSEAERLSHGILLFASRILDVCSCSNTCHFERHALEQFLHLTWPAAFLANSRVEGTRNWIAPLPESSQTYGIFINHGDIRRKRLRTCG